MRVFYKHRGIEQRFEGMTAAGGVLLAERAEGIASVAHALAYCHAVERIAACVPPVRAALVRVLHAELERIATTSTSRPSWLMRRAWRWQPPGLRCTRKGCCGWSVACAEAGSAGASWSPAE